MSAQRRPVTEQPAVPAHDEWGIYDPRRAGVPALMESLRTTGTPEPATVAQVGADESNRAESRPEAPAAAPKSGPSGSGALYTLESPVHCPECDAEIRTFRVLRVLRTHASFTSTLPRKGYVVVCPQCERMLSAELSGLV
jgi:hypothetical protein